MNGHIIQFNRGDITQNLTIRINDDNECEDDKNENFFCNLTLVSRISDINVKIHQASVSIDDFNEGECTPTLLLQPSSTSYYKTLTTGNSGSETMSPTGSPNNAQTSTATVITAGVVVVAVVLIIAIAFHCCFSPKKSPAKKFSQECSQYVGVLTTIYFSSYALYTPPEMLSRKPVVKPVRK